MQRTNQANKKNAAYASAAAALMETFATVRERFDLKEFCLGRKTPSQEFTVRWKSWRKKSLCPKLRRVVPNPAIGSKTLLGNDVPARRL